MGVEGAWAAGGGCAPELWGAGGWRRWAAGLAAATFPAHRKSLPPCPLRLFAGRRAQLPRAAAHGLVCAARPARPGRWLWGCGAAAAMGQALEAPCGALLAWARLAPAPPPVTAARRRPAPAASCLRLCCRWAGRCTSRPRGRSWTPTVRAGGGVPRLGGAHGTPSEQLSASRIGCAPRRRHHSAT